jgi:filamentous hemagglutinin family protein
MKRNLRSLFSLFFFCIAPIALDRPATAQAIPDATLGRESSVVTPLSPLGERIDGGALRGANLFHSFREFNIREGHSVYFANPEAVRTIFSRVTGNNPSFLFGRLGVLGPANLFFINPNGIIFGPKASLDIRGSFVASTASGIVFPDGTRFGATNPEGVPLLSIAVQVPVGLQFEGDASGTIINRGNLSAGQHFTSIGGTIVSTGQLSAFDGEITLATVAGGGLVWVDGTGRAIGGGITGSGKATGSLADFVAKHGELTGLTLESDGGVTVVGSPMTVETGDIAIAGSPEGASLQAQTATLAAIGDVTLRESPIATGGNLTLLARDTVRMRDSAVNPLLLVAGGALTVQGDRGVDIFALSHPASGLVSGGDLVLRSTSDAIGDAHFWSGGDFRVEKLDGSSGNLVSPHDPVIRSQGNVNFYAYQGASLHISAGGSVTANTIIITGPDRVSDTINPTATPSLANVTLSSGDSLVINGNQKPTLDIRAGMRRDAIGTPLGTIGYNSPDIFVNSSLNRVSPPGNSTVATSANISIGDVLIAPPNGLVFMTNQFQANTALDGSITINGNGVFNIGGIDATGIDGNGSDVILDSRGRIDLNGSVINSSSISGGNGGNITLLTNSLSLQDGAEIDTSTSGLGKGGNLTIIAPESVSLQGAKNYGTFSLGSRISSGTRGGGDAGDLRIETGSLSLNDGALIQSATFSSGKAGNLTVIATESILLQGTTEDGRGSLIASSTFGKGNGGELRLETNTLSLKDGSTITSLTTGEGNGGNLTIIASGSITLQGTIPSGTNRGVSSFISANSMGYTAQNLLGGNGGNIRIETRNLSLLDGALVTTSSDNLLGINTGNAGNITLIATDSITLQGTNGGGFGSSIRSGSSSWGNAGNTSIETRTLSLYDGALISTTTSDRGKGGNIRIIAPDSITLAGKNDDGTTSAIITGTVGKGDSGNLSIETGRLSLQDGAAILASTSRDGNAGSININARDSTTLTGQSSLGRGSVIATSTEGFGNANDIILNSPVLSLSDGARLSARTTSRGNAGSILVTAPIAVNIGDNSQLTVETSGAGKPGNIDLTTATLTIGRDAQLSATTTATATNSEAGGSINLNADRINIAGKLGIFAETRSTAPAGNLTLQPNNSADLNIAFTDNGFISARTTASGQGGNIDINAPRTLDIRGQGKITVETEAGGNAGNINLRGQTLTLADGLEVSASTTGSGNAGNITVNADSILLQNATINAFTNGQASAGSISLANQGNNANTIRLENSQISTEIRQNGQANLPSNITLESDRLTLDNSTLTASTRGRGNAGGITVADAREIRLNNSSITASTSGRGDTGAIELGANRTLELNNSQISSSVEQGAVGNSRQITLDSPKVSLDNSQVNATTTGQGNAGSILIPSAETVNLDGSVISTAIESTGKATSRSNIDLQTRQLILTNRSQINASTSGVGDAGNITLPSADSVTLDNSTLSTAVESGANGQGGDIAVQTNRLALDNQSLIRSSTAGEGNAGDIRVLAREEISLDNRSQIAGAAETGATGDGGDIVLTSPSLTLNNQSRITTDTSGDTEADAGKIELQSDRVSLEHQSRITATTSAGRGGTVDVTANTLSLLNGSQIRTTTSGANNAGDTILKIRDNLTLSATDSGIFADTDVNSLGNGGRILIDPIIFVIRDGATVSVNSQGWGTGGDIEISADSLTLDRGVISARTLSTTGGNITLRIGEVLALGNGSQISTTAGTAQAGGDGGNLDIRADFILSNFYENNDITANAFLGNGGNIRITARGILGLSVSDVLSAFSDITASSQFGLDGNIVLDVSGIDPTRGLDKLVEQAIDPRIQEVCQASNGQKKAEFYNTGRGGLPSTIEDFPGADLAGSWTPWVETTSAINIEFIEGIETRSPARTLTGYRILPCQQP